MSSRSADGGGRGAFWGAALTLPTINSAVGIDGGAIFQILATENLGIGSRALGIAFGMGILSVPVQLWAARLPLWRARRNLQLHLAITAVQVAILAALVAALGPGDPLVIAALAVTVLGEINVSVLYATTWQPLLSYGLAPLDRQRLSSRGAAVSGLTKATAAVAFGAGGTGVRVAILCLFAAGAVALAIAMRRVPVPPRTAPADDPAGTPPTRVPAAMRPLYIAVGLTAAGTWPLFLVYASKVLWPTVNLGVLAALQLGGSLVAAASWRATHGEVAGRARWAALVSAAATVLLAAVPTPVFGTVEKAAVLVAAVAASAATTIVFFTIMELAHRVIDERTSVRSMTIYDVVASTSMQAGLLVSGFLIAMSADHHWARVDPYKGYLVVTSVAVFAVFARLAPRRPAPE